MTEKEDEKAQANPAYALSQLARAFLGKGESSAKKIQQWQQILVSWASGVLLPGSRTPVAGVPAWVTLEVAHGGFATGNFAAGGILQNHEHELLNEMQKLGLAPELKGILSNEYLARATLNLHFSSESGRRELCRMLADGCYRIRVPEEAALLVAAFLMERNLHESSEKLLEQISPYFDRLRFYPEPCSRALREVSGDTVFLETAGRCAKRLRDKSPQQSILVMRESLTIWTPLYDRILSLYLETVEGEIPELLKSENGQLARQANGQPIAAGGYPLKRFPPDWNERASSWLKDYEKAVQVHKACGKHRHKKSNFSRLRHYLEIACRDPHTLTARDLGLIRKILASSVTAHGAPDSEKRKETRKMQAEMAALPLHTALASVLAGRLEREPADEGVPDLESLFGPVAADEFEKYNVPERSSLPPSIKSKALSCTEASLSALVEKKIICSSETLALLLPNLTARIRAARITDRGLARLFQSSYLAFRKRRSLLLLNLESQVRFEELPWISALGTYCGSDKDTHESARDALRRSMLVNFRAFPYTITPNKLVREIRAQAKVAQLNVHFVDELAADIFMGVFASNFLYAAQDAARLLQGSLYERYYGLDYSKILLLDDLEKKWGVMISPAFSAACYELAGLDINDKTQASSVALNGMVLEQAQILTTHNLAGLWASLELAPDLQAELPELARGCFKWITKCLQRRFPEWRAELKTIKNCAYAFRQMIFYLSLCKPSELDSFNSWAAEYLDEEPVEFQRRFAPVMQGLLALTTGESFDKQGNCSNGGRRFLGWSSSRHFLKSNQALSEG